MNWIFDNFQFVLIVALALASWLKHRAEAKAAEAEARRELEEGAGSDDGYDAEPDWTVPEMPQMPPPLARPAATPPPLRVDPVEMDAVLQRQQELQERLKQIKAAKVGTVAKMAKARPTGSAGPPNTMVSVGPGLRAALRNPDQTRRAVVLREILGPPVGLR